MPEPTTLLEIYQTSFRQPLFSGFMTATGLIFSVMTFLITNLFKEIYNNPEYKKRVQKQRKYDSRVTQSGQLRRIKFSLMACIVCTFLASISQMTIGFLQYSFAAVLCLLFGLVGVAGVTGAFVIVFIATKEWLDFLDKESANEPPSGDDAPSASS